MLISQGTGYKWPITCNFYKLHELNSFQGPRKVPGFSGLENDIYEFQGIRRFQRSVGTILQVFSGSSGQWVQWEKWCFCVSLPTFCRIVAIVRGFNQSPPCCLSHFSTYSLQGLFHCCLITVFWLLSDCALHNLKVFN